MSRQRCHILILLGCVALCPSVASAGLPHALRLVGENLSTGELLYVDLEQTHPDDALAGWVPPDGAGWQSADYLISRQPPRPWLDATAQVRCRGARAGRTHPEKIVRVDVPLARCTPREVVAALPGFRLLHATTSSTVDGLQARAERTGRKWTVTLHATRGGRAVEIPAGGYTQTLETRSAWTVRRTNVDGVFVVTAQHHVRDLLWRTADILVVHEADLVSAAQPVAAPPLATKVPSRSGDGCRVQWNGQEVNCCVKRHPGPRCVADRCASAGGRCTPGPCGHPRCAAKDGTAIPYARWR